MTNKIVFENVSKSYGKFKALDDIDLEIPEGMFGLLGPNGAGKTTFMKILVTLLDPSKGKVLINGHDAANDKMDVRNIIGFLPQEFSIYPQLTAHEFLEYIAGLNGIKDKSKITKALEQVNLLEVKNKKVGGFSGGMKRRLGIAQAILKEPKILIVDEPTAGLDPEERIRLRTLLVELSQERSVILSTHIVEDISSTCENIAFIVKGSMKYIGSTDVFINKAKGKVREFVVKNTSYLSAIKLKYRIISLRRFSDHTLVRAVGDYSSEDGGNEVEPNLEEAYVYFMHEDDPDV